MKTLSRKLRALVGVQALAAFRLSQAAGRLKSALQQYRSLRLLAKSGACARVRIVCYAGAATGESASPLRLRLLSTGILEISPVLDVSLLDHYNEHGFAIARGLLDLQADIDPVVDEYTRHLDRLVGTWLQDGKLQSGYDQLPFFERLLCVVREAESAYDQHFDISLPQDGVTEATPMHHGPAVFALLRSPRLLDAVEAFVGGEIYSNPVQHTRIKIPERLLPEPSRTGLTVQIAWHQDLGVVTVDADNTEMLTVWLPITRATVENGCLAVMPGSHREPLELHCRSRNQLTLNQVSIPERLVHGEPLPLPMEPGDVLFMHRRTKHCGLPNQSDEIRWSFDLRYHPIGQPTGRPWFPGFVARSRQHPETELRSASAWAESWRQARQKLADSQDVAFNRWKAGDIRCA